MRYDVILLVLLGLFLFFMEAVDMTFCLFAVTKWQLSSVSGVDHRLSYTQLNHKMSNAELATRSLWQTADAVCFDVDSTVCMDEAIDELAKFVGKEKEVMEMTLKAMRGGMTFREALSRRLDLIQPSTSILKEYLKSHPPHLTPGVKELVRELQDRDIPVYLISGGFRTIIEPVAEQLDIPVKNVFANSLKFYFNGDYAGFDENEPTSHQEGKAEVIAYLKHRFGYRRMIMIGDGATDLAACPPADAFIGFGGNQIREKVKKEAKWFVMDFKELTDDLRQNSHEY